MYSSNNVPPPSYEAATFSPQLSTEHYGNLRRPIMGEIKSFDNLTEQKLFEELADFYSIFKATESLEIAYSRDSMAVSRDAYSENCSRLIGLFKDSEVALRQSGKIRSAEDFIREYNIDCPRAVERLLKAGVPATVIHPSTTSRAENVTIAQTVQAFITAMDALKLNQRAIDEIQPLISDLLTLLRKVNGMKADFEGIVKMMSWMLKFSGMRAVDEIQEDDARQLIFDLDSSYSAFHRYLSTDSSP